MNLRPYHLLSFVCPIVVSACTSPEPANSTSSSSSNSSTGTAGMGGTGGTGGAGGSGGIVMNDDILCSVLDAAKPHSPLVAGVDEASAPLMAAADEIYDVTIPQAGGFVALQLTSMHSTFAVFASNTDAFEVLFEGTPVVETMAEATCNELKFQRFQHHSHDPLKFVVALPPTPTNQRVVFYHLL